jgi:hypothetical protein
MYVTGPYKAKRPLPPRDKDRWQNPRYLARLGKGLAYNVSCQATGGGRALVLTIALRRRSPSAILATPLCRERPFRNAGVLQHAARIRVNEIAIELSYGADYVL